MSQHPILHTFLSSDTDIRKMGICQRRLKIKIFGWAFLLLILIWFSTYLTCLACKSPGIYPVDCFQQGARTSRFGWQVWDSLHLHGSSLPWKWYQYDLYFGTSCFYSIFRDFHLYTVYVLLACQSVWNHSHTKEFGIHMAC